MALATTTIPYESSYRGMANRTIGQTKSVILMDRNYTLIGGDTTDELDLSYAPALISSLATFAQQLKMDFKGFKKGNRIYSINQCTYGNVLIADNRVFTKIEKKELEGAFEARYEEDGQSYKDKIPGLCGEQDPAWAVPLSDEIRRRPKSITKFNGKPIKVKMDDPDLKDLFYTSLKDLERCFPDDEPGEFGALVEEDGEVFFANVEEMYQPVKAATA